MTARRLILFLAICLSLTAGCQPDRPRITMDGDIIKPTRPSLFSRDMLNADIASPPGIAEDLIVPLRDEKLDKAKLSLKKILASIDRPEYLDTPVPMVSEDQAPLEPPLAAQLAYVHSRIAWRDGDPTRTKQQLEAAARLLPNEPVLLRLLGEVYTRTGNRVKGAHFFRQAIDIDPDDARSVYILGRFAIDKGDHDEAIVLFNDALGKVNDEPALTELTYHFLGNALRSSGYIAAAIEQFDRYIELSESPVRPSRFARDQVLLRRQIGVTHQLLGDLNMLLNRPDEALFAYARAIQSGATDRVKLDKRQIYAALMLRDADLAREMVIEQVQRQRGDAQSLAMVRYAVNQGINATTLADAIQTVYESEGRLPQLAIATADVMTTDRAKALLTEHLNQNPADAQVFHRLLRYYLLPVDQAPHSDQALSEAAGLTAQLMSKAPGLADEYGSALVTHTPDPQSLLDVIESSAGEKQDPAMRIVLRGLCLAVQGQFDQAQAQFEQAVEREPSLLVARVELAKALVVQNEFERAAEVLAPLVDSNESGVIMLRSRVLAETDRVQEAVDLIDRVIRLNGGDAKLIITKANMEIRLGRVEDAEQTLQDALNAEPTSEPIYEALLNLYDPAPGRASVIKDQTAKWRILVKRLLGTIPNSRTGRLVQAQLHDASRNYDRASAILEGLLAENPDDAKALTQLLDTYHAAGRTGEAIAMLESRLEAHPDNPLLLQIAQRFYQQAGDQDRLFDVQERLLMLEPESPLRDGRLGLLYLNWGRYDRAVEVLESALSHDDVSNPVLMVSLLSTALTQMGEPGMAEQRILKAAERFTDHEAELKYMLAVKIVTGGDPGRGEQLMRDILSEYPDHGPTNNGLGYAMLMRNEEPQKALELIQRAVDSDPDNEAFVDSLGWAYYKLGRFEDAEVWLTKAKESAMLKLRTSQGGGGSPTLAVVNDHLGDALYRLGREPEALRCWSEAGGHMRRVTPDDKQQDPELASLTERVTEKIKAVRAKTPVPVSDVASPPEVELEPVEPDKPEPKMQPQEAKEPKPQAKPAAEPVSP